MKTEHDKECQWWKDWHSCSCGVFDMGMPFCVHPAQSIPLQTTNLYEELFLTQEVCHEIIPGTFIACGEGVGNHRQYCSSYCFNKAKELDDASKPKI